MPPHCDSLDGPVVTAARARSHEKTSTYLPVVKKDGEAEVRAAFDLAVRLGRRAPKHGRSRIDSSSRRRCECIGQGRARPSPASSPPGSNVGPVIPIAERALPAARRKSSSTS